MPSGRCEHWPAWVGSGGDISVTLWKISATCGEFIRLRFSASQWLRMLSWSQVHPYSQHVKYGEW